MASHTCLLGGRICNGAEPLDGRMGCRKPETPEVSPSCVPHALQSTEAQA